MKMKHREMNGKWRTHTHTRKTCSIAKKRAAYRGSHTSDRIGYVSFFLWLVRNMIIQSIRSRTALIIEITCSPDIICAIPCLSILYRSLFFAFHSLCGLVRFAASIKYIYRTLAVQSHHILSKILCLPANKPKR